MVVKQTLFRRRRRQACQERRAHTRTLAPVHVPYPQPLRAGRPTHTLPRLRGWPRIALTCALHTHHTRTLGLAPTHTHTAGRRGTRTPHARTRPRDARHRDAALESSRYGRSAHARCRGSHTRLALASRGARQTWPSTCWTGFVGHLPRLPLICLRAPAPPAAALCASLSFACDSARKKKKKGSMDSSTCTSLVWRAQQTGASQLSGSLVQISARRAGTAPRFHVTAACAVSGSKAPVERRDGRGGKGRWGGGMELSQRPLSKTPHTRLRALAKTHCLRSCARTRTAAHGRPDASAFAGTLFLPRPHTTPSRGRAKDLASPHAHARAFTSTSILPALAPAAGIAWRGAPAYLRPGCPALIARGY